MPAPWEEYAAASDASAKPWEEYAGKKPEKSLTGQALAAGGNLLAGAVRGAGSIGATVLAPVDAAARALGVQNDFIGRTDRREAMDGGLQEMGAAPSSLLFKTGKLGAEVAGTAGAGGVLANGVRALGATRAAAGLEPIISGVARGLETGGFRVGDLAGTGAGTLARLGTGAAVGGASAGMVNPSDAGAGALIGGMLPGAAQVAGKAGSAIRKSLAPEIAPEVRKLAQRAQDLGINIPADRLVDSKPLNAVAAGLNYVPLSGRAATEDAMASQLNRKLSNTFGQDSSNVTMALRKADDVLGSQFDGFLKSNTVKLDKQFLDDLAAATNQASKELGTEGAGIIGKQVDEILAKAGTGEIDGQAAYNIKKTLDRIGKRNSPEAWYALDLKAKLMDALDRSVGAQKAAEFKGLRQQYGNMLGLQKMATNGAEGEISVARLANMKNIRNPQMQELADIAAQFVKPREGQHGAAQRALVGAASFGLGGVPGLLGGAAVGRATNSALNSQAVKGLLMREPSIGGLLAEPQTLGLLTQGLAKTAPLLPAQ
jgi:hypothetical protein